MKKETIIENIRNSVTTDVLTIDDVFIELNKLLEDKLVLAIKDSNGSISFPEGYPRIISCCFSEVQELDVKKIWFEDRLRFLCEEPESGEEYKLDADDFLLGELRHVLDKIE